VSDGSPNLHFWDPDSLQEVRRVRVTDPANGGAVQASLNELEYVHGWVWANVWLTDTIVVIDPSTGAIARRWNMRELTARVSNPGRDVLNGIAYTVRRGLPTAPTSGGDGGASTPWGGSLWVTGKRWDKIFELALGDPQPVARGGARALGDGASAQRKKKPGGKKGGSSKGGGPAA
jgi:glutaminyl-peptide cyclotransferase